MFINKILRYFSGNIRFEVTNGFAERLINLCALNNIELWDIEKTGEGFIAGVCAINYKKVKELAKKSNVSIYTLSKRGFVFKADKYKNRVGFILGILLFFTFLISMQNIIWQIDISGNEKVKTEVILSELSSIGIKKFAFIPAIDLQSKKQEALLNIPQLSWIGIKRMGCTIKVQVSERKMKPIIEENTPCDIVAAKTGFILYMEVYNGKSILSPKNTVQKGETIISAQLTDEKQVHAAAKVIAQVQFDKSLSVNIEELSKSYTGHEKTRRFLSIFSFKLPLFIAVNIGEKENEKYDVTETENKLNFFGIETPFGIYTQTFKYYEEKPEKLSKKDAQKVLLKCFEQYQATELKDCVIVKRTPQQTMNGSILTIKMDYIVEENIAEEKPLNKESPA